MTETKQPCDQAHAEYGACGLPLGHSGEHFYTPPELRQHAVITKEPVGVAWRVQLDCGHEVWFVTEPPDKSFCGVCIDAFVTRARKDGRVGE